MAEQSVLEHLDELRKRLIRVAIVVLTFFFIATAASTWLIKKISKDLVKEGFARFITLTPTEFIITQLKLGLILAIAMSLPFIIYQLIGFLKPALRRNEKQAVLIIMPSVLALFALGIVFSYSVLLKVVILFLGKLGVNAGIANMWSIGMFISFIAKTCFIFGLLFELPVVLLILKKLSIISTKSLRKQRKYVYVLLFIAAALLTPPDFITQLLMALPLVILYELSLLIARIS